jgi:hypothetical protein
MDEGIEVGRLAEIARIEMERRRRIVGGELKFAASNTSVEASSDKRAAIAHPAGPAPTTM